MPDIPASTPIPFSGDALSVLNECRALFVTRVVDILRQGMVRDPAVLEIVGTEIGKRHDELVASGERTGFDSAKNLTISKISLVGDDFLELEICIGEVIRRLRDNERIDHWRAQLRYMNLLRRESMSVNDNPIGLDPIRRGLWAFCSESEGSLDRHLDRLQRLEEALRIKLPEVYQEINWLLEKHGVQPVPAPVVRQTGSERATAASGAGSRKENPFVALYRAMLQQAGCDVSAQSGGALTTATPDAATLGYLLTRFDTIEQRWFGALRSGGPAQNVLKQFVPRALNSGDLDLPPDKPVGVLIDTLSKVFTTLFASSDLPDTVKAILWRLEIPVLKWAMLSPDFVYDEDHPARRLVNRLGRAAVGLPPDAPRDDLSCQRLADLVDESLPALVAGSGDLTPLIAALDALIARHDEVVRFATRGQAELIDEHERNETASANARHWLGQVLARVREPVVSSFLETYWVRVMQRACLADGIGGKSWTESDNVVKHLLWSVMPKNTPEERQKLTNLIPALIRQINAGLDESGVSMEERKPFLNAFFELQTKALYGKTDDTPTSSPRSGAQPSPTPSAATAPSSRAPILGNVGRQVHYWGEPSATASTSSRGPVVALGDWLSFRSPDDDSVRCGMICWQSGASGTLLLANPAWSDAIALSPRIVELQLQNGAASISSNERLFDIAATRALERLKDERSGT